MRLITVAIHTCDRAIELKTLLESEGIPVTLQNVNLENPEVSSGMRLRIPESDLPLALRIIENTEIFKFIDAQHGDKSRTVLVPVDFSQYSLRAARVAFDLAHAHHADVVFMHTYIDPYVGSNVQLSDALTFDLNAESDARRQIEHGARALMQSFTQRVRELIKSGAFAPVKFTTLVEEGVPEDAIEDYANVHTPYLIVMGTRGSQRKSAEMIGSVAAEVIDKCRTTVLSVPEPWGQETAGTADGSATAIDGVHALRPGNILFIPNMDQSDILAMDTVSRIFPGLDANIIMAETVGRRRPFERTTASSIRSGLPGLLGYCQKNYPNFKFQSTIVNVDKSLDGIFDVITHHKIDMVVVPNKRRRKFLGRLINPGMAQRLIMAVDIPMLVIRV